MKFVSFFLIFLTITFTISIKLLVANQETKLKNINQNISKLNLVIETLETDISYSTRPQKLEEINSKEFNYKQILQSDLIKLKD